METECVGMLCVTALHPATEKDHCPVPGFGNSQWSILQCQSVWWNITSQHTEMENTCWVQSLYDSLTPTLLKNPAWSGELPAAKTQVGLVKLLDLCQWVGNFPDSLLRD